jgi:hypothetical protein
MNRQLFEDEAFEDRPSRRVGECPKELIGGGLHLETIAYGL